MKQLIFLVCLLVLSTSINGGVQEDTLVDVVSKTTKTLQEAPNGVTLACEQVPVDLASQGYCFEVAGKLEALGIKEDEFITASVSGPFLNNKKMRQEALNFATRLHSSGWLLKEEKAQLAVYRGTMMEKMLDKFAPVSKETSASEVKRNHQIRRSINACLGWAEGTEWAKTIEERQKAEFSSEECTRLKSLIKARQRIKISEEKYNSAEQLADTTSPWITKLGANTTVSAPLACTILDRLIVLTLDTAIRKISSQQADGRFAALESLVKEVEKHLTNGEKEAKLKFCGVEWPHRAEDMERTELELNRFRLQQFYRAYVSERDSLLRNEKDIFNPFFDGGTKKLPPQEAKKLLKELKKTYRDLLEQDLESADPDQLLEKSDPNYQEIKEVFFAPARPKKQ
ncbi:MAG: hypothetical protein HQK52_18210 [Oligoflexia bacterium]|nr:hypothetical protein [Oligoflexia bacterium]